MKAEAGPAMPSLHQPIEIFCSYPDVEFKGWPQCERYVPHALVCADLVKQSDLMLLEAADLLNSAGHYLRERARYCEAEPLYVHTLAICEEQFGVSHLYTAISLNNLADLYQSQGKSWGTSIPIPPLASTISPSTTNTGASISKLVQWLSVL